jgi:flagellin-like hook-associated protein FlgL
MSSFGDINRVNTNIQAQESQLSLNRINRDLANNQLRLSTGLRINKAEDDAAGYSIATKLNARVAGLDQALANVGDAKSVLDIAEGSLMTIMDQIIEMKALATQAANDTLGTTERNFIATQLIEIGNNINDIANQTVFQDYSLLNGKDGEFSDKLDLTFQVGERSNDTLTVGLDTVSVNALFASSDAIRDITPEVGTFTVNLDAVDAASVDRLGITIGDNTVFVPISATDDAITTPAGLAFRESAVDAINNQNIPGITAELERDADGELTGNVSIINKNLEAVTVGFYDSVNSFATVAQSTINAATGTGPAEGQGKFNMADWTSENFRNFIADIDEAITNMAERVNTIGVAQSSLSIRETTLSQAISANSSASSRIMDTDFAKEQSESIRLQILQQTATSALAQANNGPQSVLGFLQ